MKVLKYRSETEGTLEFSGIKGFVSWPSIINDPKTYASNRLESSPKCRERLTNELLHQFCRHYWATHWPADPLSIHLHRRYYDFVAAIVSSHAALAHRCVV